VSCTVDSGFLAALVGMTFGLLASQSGAFWAARREAQQTKRLVAGLEAEAELETARAIREVNRALDAGGKDTGGEPAAWENRWSWSIGRESSRREMASAHMTVGIAGAVDRFYAQALLHANVWLVASVVAASVGLVLIVWEVIQASNQPVPDAVLKVTSAAVAEAVAALFYRQANATRKHAAELLASTQGDRWAEAARQILSTIEDVGRREEIAARLALHLAGAAAVSRGRSAGPTTTRATGSGQQLVK
jgi:hypothetical protein